MKADAEPIFYHCSIAVSAVFRGRRWLRTRQKEMHSGVEGWDFVRCRCGDHRLCDLRTSMFDDCYLCVVLLDFPGLVRCNAVPSGLLVNTVKNPAANDEPAGLLGIYQRLRENR